ncbi:MqnA/MqnD/SBP family protein [Saltatorellus ferox]|uniref:MqnA/MqnD/SBP family protein n=1 Tax=Saltatorellus ferox TaxID=2528018 RepID=UPI003AF3A7BF
MKPSQPQEGAERVLHVGISTCPNDTYLFHALLQGKIETPGLRLNIELMDVQELNDRLSRGEFDVAKASYHLALRHADELVALPTGSALGFGNGPVLLARTGLEDTIPGPEDRVLCPGAETTATLLYRLFYSLSERRSAEPEQVVFSEIMPALESGEADYGVCIHEGRFTYEEKELCHIEDLGAAWESETKSPLPLGGLFARRTLDDETMDRVQDALWRSLAYADDHREETLPTMAAHAQELDEHALWEHVDLYVNGWTRRLGHEGEAAIQALGDFAREKGLLSQDQALEVFVPRAERRLFHLIRADGEFEALSVDEILEGYHAASLDEEGFVHFSFAHQLGGTLEAYFADATRVLLLEIDRAAVLEDLRMEPSRRGEDFPHLYRALAPGKDVLQCWELRPSDSQEEGAPRWPEGERTLLLNP